MYVFLDPPQGNKVMLSQTSRLFASTLVPDIQDQDYLLTSDVDLWPFSANPYVLYHHKSLLVLNFMCCGMFEHKGVKVRQVPMSNIGASVKTWKELVTTGNRSLPSTAKGIVEYFNKEFNLSMANIKKGSVGWYFDQKMVSILIHEWMKKGNHKDKVYMKARNVGSDRIDRGNWKVETLEGKTDSHLLLVDGYKMENWQRTLKLLELMYPKNASEIDFANSYVDKFRKCVQS